MVGLAIAIIVTMVYWLTLRAEALKDGDDTVRVLGSRPADARDPGTALCAAAFPLLDARDVADTVVGAFAPDARLLRSCPKSACMRCISRRR
jgi:hypothetical protein